MRLTNTQLENFITRIKLKKDDMPKYRERVRSLNEKLEEKIKNDKRTGIKVSKSEIAGSWKKGTILRKTGDYPIDVDLILYVEGDEDLSKEIKKLHDFIAGYLEEIYPNEAKREIDAEGKTKSIKISFPDIGFEVDVVPVVPIKTQPNYVWQPERGGGGDYTTSISLQLEFASKSKENNSSYASIVRAIKWWRNEKELRPSDTECGLTSFAIELILSHLDETKGVEQNIERALIRFFEFVTTMPFPVIKFKAAINSVPAFDTPIYVCDPTNNENNSLKKLTPEKWNEIKKEADLAFEALNRAIARNYEGDTIDEWKDVFGRSFNIENVN